MTTYTQKQQPVFCERSPTTCVYYKSASGSFSVSTPSPPLPSSASGRGCRCTPFPFIFLRPGTSWASFAKGMSTLLTTFLLVEYLVGRQRGHNTQDEGGQS